MGQRWTRRAAQTPAGFGLASKGKSGNGTFKFKGKSTKARRVSYKLEFGPIQKGLLVRVGQNCNPACVNPAHLAAMARAESNRINGFSHLTAYELFWEKVDKAGGPESCWPWTAGKTKYGTGIFNFNGKPTPAPRVSYELEFGPIEEGLEIRAGQDCTRGCVNPAHLVAMTKSEGGSISGKHQLTYCKKGHPFTEDNIYINSGRRHCLICRIDNREQWLAQLLEELANLTPEPEKPLPDRPPVHPEFWGERQRVIRGRIVDDKFERRFWRKVDCTGGPTACWFWLGGKDPGGYGLFSISNPRNSKLVRTQSHIVAYELEIGPIPEGLVIDHFRCGNKSCCNPNHLEPVTSEENIRRAHRQKPYCERGHLHTEKNSYFTDQRMRVCRACRAYERSRR